jgi:hypothetical protein
MSRKRKINKTGRNSPKLSDFIALERYILRSLAWRSLSVIARALYIEIAFCHDGSNNDRIQMSVQNLANRLGMGKSSAARALNELQEKGFIEVSKQSSFSLKLKLATEYRLAAFGCNVTNALPTKAFTRWQPENQNTVPPITPLGTISGTEDQKATGISHFQYHRQDCEQSI